MVKRQGMVAVVGDDPTVRVRRLRPLLFDPLLLDLLLFDPLLFDPLLLDPLLSILGDHLCRRDLVSSTDTADAFCC